MELDPSLLVGKVMEAVVRRCAAAAPAGEESGAADPLDAVADRVAGYLMSLLQPGEAAGTPRASYDELESVCVALAGRNRLVARALGACTCWGDDDGCEVCSGRGAPGWRRPERTAFEAFVTPALKKLSRRQC